MAEGAGWGASVGRTSAGRADRTTAAGGVERREKEEKLSGYCHTTLEVVSYLDRHFPSHC